MSRINERNIIFRRLLSIFVVGAVFALLCFFSLCYIAKDNYYVLSIYKYFHISSRLRARLIHLDISKEILCNLINICTIGFYATSYLFLFLNLDNKNTKILKFLIILWCIELIYVSSFFYKHFYMLLVNTFISSANFKAIDKAILFLFKLTNIIFWIEVTIRYFKNKTSFYAIKEVRRIFNLLGILNIFMFALFLYMFRYFPERLIWISKVANYKMFIAIEFPPYNPIMQTIPYLICVVVIAITLLFIKYLKTLQRIEINDTFFGKITNSSSLSVKTFAHYIKNELLGIVAELEMMKEEPESGNIDNLITTCNEIYEHLNNLQQDSNQIVLHKKIIDIVSVVQDYIESNQSRFKSNSITVVKELPNTPIYIFGDEFYLSRVISNISINSIEAMENLEREKKLTYEIVYTSNTVILCVKDNGHGINESIKDKIFEPFVSTKVTKKNWGIGLSFVKRIVDNLSGEIQIENINPGVLVRIVLPRVKKLPINQKRNNIP